MNALRRLAAVYAIGLVAVFVIPALGQSSPETGVEAGSRGALSASSNAGHLWLVIENGSDSGAGVWHVPVRAGGSGSGGVRWAYLLESMPVGMAAQGDRVALFFAREDGGYLVRGL